MGLISGLIGAFGSLKKGQAQAREGRIDARQINRSADIQTLLSERAEQKALGATAADVGASGLQIAGSASALIDEQKRDAEFQRKTIADEAKFQADRAIAQGKAGKTAGIIGAVGSVLGGIESAAKNAATLGLGGPS